MARPGNAFSPDLTTNDPEKQKQEQSGGITVDNCRRRDAYHHLFHQRIAQGQECDLAGTDDGNLPTDTGWS